MKRGRKQFKHSCTSCKKFQAAWTHGKGSVIYVPESSCKKQDTFFHNSEKGDASGQYPCFIEERN